jgi:hypothetical protein
VRRGDFISALGGSLAVAAWFLVRAQPVIPTAGIVSSASETPNLFPSDYGGLSLGHRTCEAQNSGPWALWLTTRALVPLLELGIVGGDGWFAHPQLIPEAAARRKYCKVTLLN